MIQFFTDALAFLKSLSTIDFILYFAVLILLILVISLIYVMRTAEEETQEEIVTGSLNQDMIDLKKIAETIDTNPTPLIDMTHYEAEQEEKAIISYDELLKSAQVCPITYDDEELVDDSVTVKKINLEQLANPISIEQTQVSTGKLFHYEREEAFLETLKQLNKLLN